MKTLTNQELISINGGAGGFAFPIIFGVSAVISFISGLLSGYTNPDACRR